MGRGEREGEGSGMRGPQTGRGPHWQKNGPAATKVIVHRIVDYKTLPD